MNTTIKTIIDHNGIAIGSRGRYYVIIPEKGEKEFKIIGGNKNNPIVKVKYTDKVKKEIEVTLNTNSFNILPAFSVVKPVDLSIKRKKAIERLVPFTEKENVIIHDRKKIIAISKKLKLFEIIAVLEDGTKHILKRNKHIIFNPENLKVVSLIEKHKETIVN